MGVALRRSVRWLVLATLPAAAACSLFYPFDDITIGEGPRDAAADGFTTSDAPAGDALPSDSGPPETSSPGCPDNGRGPAMIRIDFDIGHFCIDSTEVTRAQYQEFAESSEPPILPPTACPNNATKADFLTIGPVDYTAPDHPMNKVNWCGAYAFCAWAGKRLCGALGDGGNIPGDADTVPSRSEWMFACSLNGARQYPYGNTFDDNACNVSLNHGDATVPVGSLPGCVGGFPGLYDMTGNVYEWENSCDGVAGVNDAACRSRGGSFKVDAARCATPNNNPATQASSDWGIRCCADVKN